MQVEEPGPELNIIGDIRNILNEVSAFPDTEDIQAHLRASERAAIDRFHGSVATLGESQIETSYWKFRIKTGQLGKSLPDALQSLSKSRAFQGHGHAPPIKFDLDTIENWVRLFTIDDDPQLTYETQTGVLPGRQGADAQIACVQSVDIDNGSKFEWPRLSYDHDRPTIHEAREAIESLIARALKNINTSAVSFSSGAYVRLPTPTFQHPGERLAQLSIQPEFPDYTQVYFHIVGEDGVTGFHIEDNGLRSFNLCHVGYKAWVIIPDSSRDAFEQYVMRKLGLPASMRSQLCDQFVRHLGVLCSPAQLEEAAVEYRIVVQGPGEFVTTTPLEYHMVLGLTSSIATSNNFIYRDDPDIVAALENAKVCEQCGNYPLIRDYNVNHSTKLGSHTATVQALIQQLAKPISKCSINSLINPKHTDGREACNQDSSTSVDNNERHLRMKGDENSGRGDAVPDGRGDSGRKRSTLPEGESLAKRRKPLPPASHQATRVSATAASEATERQERAAVAASSSLRALTRRNMRPRTRESARIEVERHVRRRSTAASHTAAQTKPSPVPSDSPRDRQTSARELRSPSTSGTDANSGSGGEESDTTPATSPDSTTSCTASSMRHDNLAQFDAFYEANTISRSQLVAQPAHDRCGLAAVLYTKQHLDDFFAAVKDHQNDMSNGGGRSELEKGLSSANGSSAEDPVTCAMRDAILEMVKSDRYRIGKQRSDYKQRFFCYAARRLWEGARLTSRWGPYKAQGGGQIKLDPAVREGLIRRLLPAGSTQEDKAVLSGHIDSVLLQGSKWDSVATGIGMGIIALIPRRRRDSHVLNVAARYYYYGLHGEHSLSRLQEFQSALDTPYMKALLAAANSLAQAIVQKRDVRFAFNDYRGEKPISSLPEAEICRLLKTLPRKDSDGRDLQSSPPPGGIVAVEPVASTTSAPGGPPGPELDTSK